MKAIALAIIFAVTATPTFAWTYFFERDLGIEGFQRLCRYSNGEVYAFNTTDICPLQIEDSAPGFGNSLGFKSGEYMDGMSKICVYDVMGEERAIRIGGVELCPLNYQF